MAVCPKQSVVFSSLGLVKSHLRLCPNECFTACYRIDLVFKPRRLVKGPSLEASRRVFTWSRAATCDSTPPLQGGSPSLLTTQSWVSEGACCVSQSTQPGSDSRLWRLVLARSQNRASTPVAASLQRMWSDITHLLLSLLGIMPSKSRGE
jgi:hypothetical protein